MVVTSFGRAEMILYHYLYSMPEGNTRRCNMKISARNVLAGKITSIKPGTVNDEIVVKLTGGDEIVAIITKESSKSLKLSKNKKVYAIIKASNVMIGID